MPKTITKDLVSLDKAIGNTTDTTTVRMPATHGGAVELVGDAVATLVEHGAVALVTEVDRERRVPLPGHRSQVTGHGSQVTGHRSRVTGHGSRVTGQGLRFTLHRSRVRGEGSRVTGKG